jgi:hypothetical protein
MPKLAPFDEKTTRRFAALYQPVKRTSFARLKRDLSWPMITQSKD